MKCKVNSLLIALLCLTKMLPVESAVPNFSDEMYLACTFGNEIHLEDWSNSAVDIATIDAALKILDSSDLSNSNMAFKAQCLVKLKNLSEAAEIVAEILGREGSNLESILLSGRIAMFQGSYAKAIDAFESVIAVNPFSFTTFYLLSVAYQQTSNIPSALETIQSAIKQAESIYPPAEPGIIELRPDEVLIYTRYADLLFSIEADEEAINALIYALDRSLLSDLVFDRLYDYYMRVADDDGIEALKKSYCESSLSDRCVDHEN